MIMRDPKEGTIRRIVALLSGRNGDRTSLLARLTTAPWNRKKKAMIRKDQPQASPGVPEEESAQGFGPQFFLKKANPACPVQGHSAQIHGVRFSQDGTIIASCSGHPSKARKRDYSVRLWDVGSGRELKKFQGHRSVSFSADGSLVASCSGYTGYIGHQDSGDCSVRIWSLETRQELKKFLGHSDCVRCFRCVRCVRCVQFHPTDPGQLVTGSDDKTVKLWSVADGQCLQTLRGHGNWAARHQFHPTGPGQLVNGSWDKTVNVRSVADGQCLQTLRGHGNWVARHQFHPTGPGQLVNGSWDKTVKVRSVADGQCLQTLTGHSAPINCITLSHNGALLASCSGPFGDLNNSVRLWDLQSGAEYRKRESKGGGC
jgi:WD40 repeat protein